MLRPRRSGHQIGEDPNSRPTAREALSNFGGVRIHEAGFGQLEVRSDSLVQVCSRRSWSLTAVWRVRNWNDLSRAFPFATQDIRGPRFMRTRKEKTPPCMSTAARKDLEQRSGFDGVAALAVLALG